LGIYRHLFLIPPYHFLVDSGPDSICRHPEILRTKRQIYSEAVYVLYSELQIVLISDEILGLSRQYLVQPPKLQKHLWRHNPLDGIGHRNDVGSHIYDTPILVGFMEPHVFARFQHLAVSAHLKFTDEESRMYMHEEYNVSADDKASMLAFLRRLCLFEPLAQLLSNSPSVRRLSVGLFVNVFADIDIYKADSAKKERVFKMVEVPMERAIGFCVDSGMLDPVRNLPHVETCEHRFNMNVYYPKKFELNPEPVEMNQDPQSEIERD